MVQWSVTFAAGTAAAAPSDTLLTDHTVANYAAATSLGYAKFGMAFKDGDVPAGNVVTLKLDGASIDAQFDERSTWPSGCLRFCVATIRDSTFSSLEERIYDVYTTSGAWDNNTGVTLADLLSLSETDAQLLFTLLTHTDNSSTATHGSGSALAKLSDHAAVSTRATRIAGGNIRDAFMIWGMAKDGADGSGSEDPHLKVNWYIERFKNALGQDAHTNLVAVPAQDWWDVATKRRLNYEAELLNGVVSIQEYNATTMPGLPWSKIQHYYRAQWATVRLDDDLGHGRPHCINGTMPTLYSKPNRQYWIDSKIALPLNIALSVPSAESVGDNGGLPNDYTAMSAQGHHKVIGDTGAYMGRGLWPNFDCISFISQDPADYRVSRVCAHAGLHVAYGFRSNRSRTRPTESADTANTVMPQKLDTKDAGDYDFTGDGMPAATDCYAGSVSSLLDGYVTPTGYSGADISGEEENASAHAPNFCEFMYLLEGERYMLERMFDLATKTTIATNGNAILGRSRLIDYEMTAMRTALSTPSTQWGGVHTRFANNSRSVGWAQNLIGSAAAFCPDDDVQAGYLRLFAAHQADHMRASIDFPAIPPDMIAAGLWVCQGYQLEANWMHDFCTLGLARHAALTGDADMLYVANHFCKYSAGFYKVGRPYMTVSYRTMTLLNNNGSTPWAQTTNEFVGQGQQLQLITGTINAGTNVITWGTNGTMPVTDGDIFYPSAWGEDFTTNAKPAELSYGTPYYSINSSGQTSKLSASPGGSEIDFATGATHWFGCDLAQHEVTPATSGVYLPNDDDYAMIKRAATVMAFHAGCSNVDQGDVDDALAFTGNVPITDYFPWALTA